jgi:hypothetical protein
MRFRPPSESLLSSSPRRARIGPARVLPMARKEGECELYGCIGFDGLLLGVVERVDIRLGVGEVEGAHFLRSKRMLDKGKED